MSLQEMLTAAGEADARPRPFNTHGASNRTEPYQKIIWEILVSAAGTFDKMRQLYETRVRLTLGDFLDATAKFSCHILQLAPAGTSFLPRITAAVCSEFPMPLVRVNSLCLAALLTSL